VNTTQKPLISHQQTTQHWNAVRKGPFFALEPLLQENPCRFVLFPIQHAGIWQMYKKAKASFWTVEEIDLAADILDWD